MKITIYLFFALSLAAACEGQLSTEPLPESNPRGQDNGGPGYTVPGSEKVDGVAQPKGAVKRILEVQSDNRGWHTMDFDDTYIYDEKGRVIIDKCTQSKFEGSTGKFLFKNDYEYWRVYSGDNYEWRNSPEPESKTRDGKLNDKGQLVSMTAFQDVYTYTYDDKGQIVKYVKEDKSNHKKTIATFVWNDFGNIETSHHEVWLNGEMESSSDSGYNYDRTRVCPTHGHFLDLMYKAFPGEIGPAMLQGLAPRNLLTHVFVIDNKKVNLGKVKLFMQYEFGEDNTTITKMVRHYLFFPCADDVILLNERDISTFTIEYYK